jgi:hypothetical protein
MLRIVDEKHVVGINAEGSEVCPGPLEVVATADGVTQALN